MTHDAPRQFDPRDNDRGNVATGNEQLSPPGDLGDAPTEGSVAEDFDRKRPGNRPEDEGASSMAPDENDSETSEDLDELRRMEQNAEDGRE